MTSQPSDEYVLEFLIQDSPVLTPVESETVDFEIEIGNVTLTGEIAVPEIIEVFSEPPVGGGYDRVEVLPFTKQGILGITPTGSEFPIMGGVYTLESIAGRASIPPGGSDIIVDILKNNVSIFTNPADRPTIAEGTNNAVIGDFGTVTFVDGDFVEVLIVQVGSAAPGENLVMSIRLARIG